MITNPVATIKTLPKDTWFYEGTLKFIWSISVQQTHTQRFRTGWTSPPCPDTSPTTFSPGPPASPAHNPPMPLPMTTTSTSSTEVLAAAARLRTARQLGCQWGSAGANNKDMKNTRPCCCFMLAVVRPSRLETQLGWQLVSNTMENMIFWRVWLKQIKQLVCRIPKKYDQSCGPLATSCILMWYVRIKLCPSVPTCMLRKPTCNPCACKQRHFFGTGGSWRNRWVSKDVHLCKAETPNI